MKKMIVVLLTLLMITAALTACGKAQDQSAGSNASADTSAKTAETTAAASATQTAASSTGAKLSQPNEVVTTANVTLILLIFGSSFPSLTDSDLSDAVYYDLSDNSNITITKEGVYVISGSASNVSIIIEAGDNDKVQLVFNGATISNSSAPAVYVKNADKVFVTTVEGTTTELTVSGAFTADGETNTDAVIFSKDDLVLNGLGTLTVNSSDNGISGKDDIKITGGTINITSTSDAIEANESIAIADGTITIKTSKDALHAENDEDDSTGYIYICGGTFNIAAASDAIQATTIAQIDGGNITASAVEAIEATYVQLNGGTYNLTASDDGINATSKSKSQSVKIEINGGDITVNMGQGDTDGIDSNGDLIINGGTVNVNAQSPFDYDGQGQLNGGTVYVNGTQVTELTNQMMGGGMGGGRGGMGGDPNMNGNGGPMGGGFAR